MRGCLTGGRVMSPSCKLLMVATFALACSPALATVQQRDRVVFGDHEYGIFEVPMLGLWYYGEGEPPNGKTRPFEFDFNTTANWVGYSATWEIRGEELRLREIRGRQKGKDVKNEAILPSRKFPVAATWFTGKIHIPVGGYDENEEQFKAIIVFEIDKGDVKSMAFIPSGKISGTWDGL